MIYACSKSFDLHKYYTPPTFLFASNLKFYNQYSTYIKTLQLIVNNI